MKLPRDTGDIVTEIELIRSTEDEKSQQIENVLHYQQLRNDLSVRPERSAEGAKSKEGLGSIFKCNTPNHIGCCT